MTLTIWKAQGQPGSLSFRIPFSAMEFWEPWLSLSAQSESPQLCELSLAESVTWSTGCNPLPSDPDPICDGDRSLDLQIMYQGLWASVKG